MQSKNVNIDIGICIDIGVSGLTVRSSKGTTSTQGNEERSKGRGYKTTMTPPSFLLFIFFCFLLIYFTFDFFVVYMFSYKCLP